MLQTISRFWESNSAAILISLFTGFIFFVLGPIGVWFSGRKIRRERIRKAVDTLLDIIEGMLVSGEAIEPAKISTLFRAVERENAIDLVGSYDTDSLFDDLTLRFAKSKHLDPNQKNKYGEIVEALRATILKTREARTERRLPISQAKLFEALSEEIRNGEREQALKSLEHLQGKILKDSDIETFNPFRPYLRVYRRNPKLAIGITLFVLLVYGMLIQKFISSEEDRKPKQSVESTPTIVTPFPKQVAP